MDPLTDELTTIITSQTSDDHDDDNRHKPVFQNWSQVKDRVEDAIQQITPFATFEVSTTLTLPGLCVEGIGNIDIPVSAQQAERLLEHGRQVPLGSSDAIIWQAGEIDATKIRCNNKNWNLWLQDAASKVLTALGIFDANICTVLHKMSIYGPNYHSKAHQDVEKFQGMLGTLIICLPSQHEGGAVHVYHRGREMVFTTDVQSDYGISYMAWHAGIVHGIQPIKAGYRVNLTYSLICREGLSPVPPCFWSHSDLQGPLMSSLEYWHNLNPHLRSLCYPLEHYYTQTTLRFSCLEGSDHYRFHAIADACQMSRKYHVLLAHLERTVEETNLQQEEQQGKEKFALLNIVSRNGLVLQDNLAIESRIIIHRDLYEDRDANTRTGGEYVGSLWEAVYRPFVYTYKDAVIVIVRKDDIATFLLGKKYSLNQYKQLLRRLLIGLAEDKNDTLIRELFDQVCRLYTKEPYPKRDKDPHLNFAFVAACQARDYALAQQIMSSVYISFNEATISSIGMLYSNSSISPPTCFIDDILLNASTLHAFQACIDSFCSCIELQPDAQGIGSNFWKRAKFRDQLVQLKEVHKQDGQVLLGLATLCNEDDIDTWVHDFIIRFSHEAHFINGLAIATLTNIQNSTTHSRSAAQLLSFILENILPHFILEDYSSLLKISDVSELANRDENLDKEEASIIYTLYKRLQNYRADKASLLLQAIKTQLSTVPQNLLHRFSVPLMKCIMPELDTESSPEFSFCRFILNTLVERYVPHKPRRPCKWARPDEAGQVKCYKECADCLALRQFLLKSSSSTQLFRCSVINISHFNASVPPNCLAESDYRKGTVRVTKTDKGYEVKHAEWHGRLSQIKADFQGLPPEMMVKLLGADYQQTLSSTLMCPQKGQGSRKRKRSIPNT